MHKNYEIIPFGQYPCSCEQIMKTKCDDCGVEIPQWTRFIVVGWTHEKPEGEGMQYNRCLACHKSAQQVAYADRQSGHQAQD